MSDSLAQNILAEGYVRSSVTYTVQAMAIPEPFTKEETKKIYDLCGSKDFSHMLYSTWVT